VADLVDWLTDVSKLSDGNRKARKAIDLAHTADAPVAAKNIKLADCISNAPSITAHDPGFARKWLAEKSAILAACSDADAGLLRRAHEVLAACLNQLKGNK
jgi:(p)ppGpp synthase/HD superfamily hydrolase